MHSRTWYRLLPVTDKWHWNDSCGSYFGSACWSAHEVSIMTTLKWHAPLYWPPGFRRNTTGCRTWKTIPLLLTDFASNVILLHASRSDTLQLSTLSSQQCLNYVSTLNFNFELAAIYNSQVLQFNMLSTSLEAPNVTSSLWRTRRDQQHNFTPRISPDPLFHLSRRLISAL